MINHQPPTSPHSSTIKPTINKPLNQPLSQPDQSTWSTTPQLPRPRNRCHHVDLDASFEAGRTCQSCRRWLVTVGGEWWVVQNLGLWVVNAWSLPNYIWFIVVYSGLLCFLRTIRTTPVTVWNNGAMVASQSWCHHSDNTAPSWMLVKWVAVWTWLVAVCMVKSVASHPAFPSVCLYQPFIHYLVENWGRLWVLAGV